MSILKPESSKDYPISIITYLMLAFLIAFVFSSLSILNRVSNDGLYVQYFHCIEESTDDYGKPSCDRFSSTPNELVPVGSWLISQAQTDFILAIILVVPLGLYEWYKSSKKSHITFE